MYWRTIQLSYQ